MTQTSLTCYEHDLRMAMHVTLRIYWHTFHSPLHIDRLYVTSSMLVSAILVRSRAIEQQQRHCLTHKLRRQSGEILSGKWLNCNFTIYTAGELINVDVSVFKSTTRSLLYFGQYHLLEFGLFVSLRHVK